MTNTLIVHGTLLRVAETGVLIQGDAGSGKSRLALAMLDRQHQLIADDAIILNEQLVGKCPSKLKNNLHLRHLGMLNVLEHFGRHSIVDSARVDLIVKLDPEYHPPVACLAPEFHMTSLLDQNVPTVIFNPVAESQIAVSMELIVSVFFKQYQNHNQTGKTPLANG